jgi:hypothetical protein
MISLQRQVRVARLVRMRVIAKRALVTSDGRPTGHEGDDTLPNSTKQKIYIIFLNVIMSKRWWSASMCVVCVCEDDKSL